MSDTQTVNDDILYDLQQTSRMFKVGSGEIRAVNGLNLMIKRGEFVSIQGPSGSGKTTLLQLLGLLDTATSGNILFRGKEVNNLGDGDLTRLRSTDIGFVFQQFNLIPTLTAAENVETALVPNVKDAEARMKRVHEVLDSVGLADRMEHLPSLLSGGEQQRVAIARALANNPAVILADEPTGNLDSTTAQSIVALLAELSNSGVTVILITHDPDVANAAKRKLRMRDGQLEDSSDH